MKSEVSPPARGPFIWFLAARCLTIMAYQMVGVAVGWQIYQRKLGTDLFDAD
jgi:hypothetical protein